MNENSTEVTSEIQKVDFIGSTLYKIGQNLLTLPLKIYIYIYIYYIIVLFNYYMV